MAKEFYIYAPDTDKIMSLCIKFLASISILYHLVT